jgi:hypothetical protein
MNMPKELRNDREQKNGMKETIYCISVPKSGTTSLAGIFSQCLNKISAHEPERAMTVSYLYRHKLHDVSDDDLVNWHKSRRERLSLDMESNCFLTYRFDLFLRAFPEARIVLPVRYPKSWLRSIFDNNIRFCALKSEIVAKYHELLFNPQAYNYHSKEEESVLKKVNLYPIDAYLHYWKSTYDLIIDSVSPERLFILKTEDIALKVEELYAFAGWPIPESCNDGCASSHNSHLNISPHEYGILDLIDDDFVTDRINIICGETVQKLSNYFKQC